MRIRILVLLCIANQASVIHIFFFSYRALNEMNDEKDINAMVSTLSSAHDPYYYRYYNLHVSFVKTTGKG